MILLSLICSLYLIDQPDIKIPEHAFLQTELRFGPKGEILGFLSIGLFDRFNFGVSYGASNLIGAGNPEFYSQPGVQIRFIGIEQGDINPILIFGFDNQGYGPDTIDGERYSIISKGLYCQIGKDFGVPNIGIAPSFGISYSIEGEKGLDLFTGIRTEFGGNSVLLLDYCPGFNDAQDKGYGYFNTGLRFIFYEDLFFEFSLRDILGNNKDNLQLNRIIKLGYRQAF
jgi:hypothetical protein